MVRLKDEAAVKAAQAAAFQFHYGTIKRRPKEAVFTGWVISIPLWYD